MNDANYSLIHNTKNKFEDVKEQNNETIESCVKDKLPEIVSKINKNNEIGILKEQNFLISNTGCYSLSKLYSNRNCTNRIYNSSYKEKPPLVMNNCKKNLSEGGNNNEDKGIFTDVKSDSRKDNSERVFNIPISPNKVREKDTNGVSSVEDYANTMTDSSEVIYYAVHIPIEIPLPDALLDKKGVYYYYF